MNGLLACMGNSLSEMSSSFLRLFSLSSVVSFCSVTFKNTCTQRGWRVNPACQKNPLIRYIYSYTTTGPTNYAASEYDAQPTILSLPHQCLTVVCKTPHSAVSQFHVITLLPLASIQSAFYSPISSASSDSYGYEGLVFKQTKHLAVQNRIQQYLQMEEDKDQLEIWMFQSINMTYLNTKQKCCNTKQNIITTIITTACNNQLTSSKLVSEMP